MKIYTYANPLDLDCASFWDEVREYPHLCISRTLVQGLVMKFGRTTFQYIDTIQSFMDCFYKTWEDEPQNNIAQYVSISEKTNGIKDPSIKKAMKFNKGQVFEAIRMLFELDLDADKFDGSALTEEQAVLLDIYKDLQGERCWEVIRKLSTKTAEQVNNAIITILDSEIRKELSINLQEDIKEAIDERIRKVEKELASLVPLKEDSKRRALINKLGLYNHYKKLNTKRDFIQHKKIVFHGVHQFTPIILRLISHLKTLGFEIIFLFNYNRQFKRVYDTWNRIYGNFRPGIKPDVVCNMNRSANKEIGTALGELLDGLPVQKYKLTERVQVFDNLTSFTDYVAKEYEEAKKNAGRGKSVLAQMNKQFYGVQSKEVNEMLKTQFPEQFGERHFLAHPIGGFILGLYNMWNTQEGVLKIDEANLKECLSANLWHSDSSITPIELFDRIKLYFKDCETISQWIERAEFLKEKLMAIIRGEELLENRLKDINQMQPACWLKKFSFYSISEDEVNYFIRILKEIELLAEEIFGSSKGGRIDFVKHFERLIQQIRIKMQRNKSIEREQVELVEEIFQRLNRPLYDEILGTVEDLKEALHFYLDKKQNPDNSANWIVRDFEQIDGGVLLSERTDNKIYHYALLSDRNMKGRQRDFLPWPITMEMLSGYKDRCRELAVFLCAAGEYKNFLRFSLFYGAYFLLSDLELSYVENSEGEREAPYFALEMLGLKKDYQSGCFDYDVQRALDQKKPERDCELDFSNEEVETFSICPYRFVLDTIEGDRYYYQSEFQCRYYYIVFLTLLVRKLSAGETKEQVRQCFEKKAELLRKYFPFWSNIDFRDIEQKVWKDLMDQLNRADRMRPIGNPDKYPRRKNRFLFAKYVENGENLMQFSCTEDTKNNLEKYLLDNRVDEFNNKNIEGFCDYCCKREVCLNQYIER